MIEDIHNKAQRLILESSIEDLQHSDQIWLDEHLKDCPVCREYMDTAHATIIRLKSTSFSMNPELMELPDMWINASPDEMPEDVRKKFKALGYIH